MNSSPRSTAAGSFSISNTISPMSSSCLFCSCDCWESTGPDEPPATLPDTLTIDFPSRSALSFTDILLIFLATVLASEMAALPTAFAPAATLPRTVVALLVVFAIVPANLACGGRTNACPRSNKSIGSNGLPRAASPIILVHAASTDRALERGGGRADAAVVIKIQMNATILDGSEK